MLGPRSCFNSSGFLSSRTSLALVRIYRISLHSPFPILVSRNRAVFGLAQNATNPAVVSANLSPNSDSLLTNTTYNAEQRALYDAGKPSAYSIISTLSTNFGSLSLKDAAASYKRIIAKAVIRNASLSLPTDVDPTVLAGYRAQRALTLKQYASQNVAVGTLFWGTANQAQSYLLKPLSRGTVNIHSADPNVEPLIDYRTGTDPTDFDVYTALFRKNRELFAAPSMQVLGPEEAAPWGTSVNTDEDIIAVMRDQINPSNAHQCCTAAMMPKRLGGVVSSSHKVYGVRGLRVADVSFWPMQISASPMATVYASAEKLADMIKKEYGL